MPEAIGLAASCRRKLPYFFSIIGLILSLVLMAIASAWGQSEAQSGVPIRVQPNVSPPNWEDGVVFAPNGKFLAVQDGNRIKLWETATGRPLRTLEQFAYVNRIVFARDGSQLISAHKDGEIKIWDTLTGTLIASQHLFDFHLSDSFNSLRIDEAKTQLVLTTSFGFAGIWDYKKGIFLFRAKKDPGPGDQVIRERLPSFTDVGRLTDARLSKDGRKLIVGGSNGIVVVELNTAKTVQTIKLDERHALFRGGILDDTTFLVQSGGSDCDTDLLLLTAAPPKRRLEVISSAAGCRTKDNFGDIKVFQSNNGTLYFARNGVPGVKTWNLKANRFGPSIDWYDGKEQIVSFDHTFTQLATTDGKRLHVRQADGTLTTLQAHGSLAKPTASYDGSQILLQTSIGSSNELVTWSVNGVTPSYQHVQTKEGFKIVDVSLETNLALASNDKGDFIVYSASSGEETASVSVADVSESWFEKLSPDGKKMLLIAQPSRQGRLGIITQDLSAGDAKALGLAKPHGIRVLKTVDGSPAALAGIRKNDVIVQLDGRSVSDNAGFMPSPDKETRVTLIRDGTWRDLMVHVGTRTEQLAPIAYLVDIERGTTLVARKERGIAIEERREENGDTDHVTSVAFSPDGSRFAFGWWHGAAEIWSMDTLQLLGKTARGDDQTKSLAFSPDGRFLIGGSRDSGIFVWNVNTLKLERKFSRESLAGHVSTAGLAISRDGEMLAAGPYQRAVSSGDTGAETRVQVWDVASGERRFFLSGHESNVWAISFTDDRRWIVTASRDGRIRYWNRGNGQLAATVAIGSAGRWVIVTEKGFFAASSNAGDLLSVVRGYNAISIDQLWQSLYGPDLVREYLSGDKNGEFEKALAHSELSSILDSGPTPSVDIVSPKPGETSADLIEVSARVTDMGSGVGRIEWRVNGVTAAVASDLSDAGSGKLISRKIALDQGDNVIEVVAYNAQNLLASLPARISMTLAQTALVKPKLHVLAIGINAYVDRGWSQPGASATQFAPLNLAVKDAMDLAHDLKQASKGLYEEVRVVTALDSEGTLDNLQNIMNRLTTEIEPRDTFVLFAAAHGTSVNGHFYLIPQDYQGGLNPEALVRSAISQTQLQEWLARIKAKRAIILLDTCESGAVIAGYLRSRTSGAASEAAIGRLHEATGRPVLTASAEGQFAYEGLISDAGQRHGVFTYALLDSLRKGDTNGDGVISLSELVGHVQGLVPKLSAKFGGAGRAAIAASEPGNGRQTARFGSRGEDFTLARRLPN